MFCSYYLFISKPRKLFLYPKDGQYYYKKLYIPTLDWLNSLVKDYNINAYLSNDIIDLCQSLLNKKE